MKEDIPFLKQMLKSLEELASKLETHHKNDDFKNFIVTKKLMLKIQKEILGKVK
ncbi:hypothetical protein HY448_01975 [Candidatus Pacearchaeota archaeon]|nr:hypothetical protein [Candidatus Pacearchaeota archaeon]